MKGFSTLFITGVNGSGKSTLVPLLRKMLPAKYAIHDFDERGVPKNVDAKWRQLTTRHWLQVARRNIHQNVITVVCGLAKPAEIHQAVLSTQKHNVHIALLEVSASQIAKRLRRRYSSPRHVRLLKRVTNLTVEECISANIEHAKELRAECKKYNCKVFNTTISTPKRTVAKVVRWIVTQ